MCETLRIEKPTSLWLKNCILNAGKTSPKSLEVYNIGLGSAFHANITLHISQCSTQCYATLIVP